MTVTGDRQSASLLAALAEAPDSAAASSFLAAQIAEMCGAGRVLMLRLDAAQEALISVAGNETGETTPMIAIPLSDLGNPLIISALSLSPVIGERPLASPLSAYRRWT